MGLNVGKGGKGGVSRYYPPMFTLKKMKKWGVILGGKAMKDGCYRG